VDHAVRRIERRRHRTIPKLSMMPAPTAFHKKTCQEKGQEIRELDILSASDMLYKY
jgi:hypothetical protein